MEPGQNRRDANNFSTRRCTADPFPARNLDQFGAEYPPGIEVNSTRLIENYVANGYRIGATVATPGFKPPPRVRVISLPSFPPVIVGAAWAGKLSR